MKKAGGFAKKHKKALIIVGVIAVIAVVIIIFVHRAKKKTEELLNGMTRETYVLEKRDLTESVSGTGKISSVHKQDIVLASMANTKVTSLNVKLGDAVKEGDIICTFDTEDIERSLAEAREDLAIAQKKTANSMDNQSRGLYETQLSAVNDTNRNHEAVDRAQREYDTAAGEKAEASRVFDEVYDVYEEYYDEDKYYDLQEEYTDLKKKLESYVGNEPTAPSTSGFDSAKSALIEFLSLTFGDDPNTVTVSAKTILTGLSAGTSTEITAGNLVEGYAELSTDDEDQATAKNKIETLVANLQTANASYISAASRYREYNDLVDRSRYVSNRITNMETAKANMNSAKSGVDSAQSKLNSAGDALENAKRTQEDKLRSDINGVKDAENNYDSAKLDSSVAGRSYEDNIRKYEKQLEDAVLTAPFDGLITAVNVSEGSTYPGQTVVTIEDMSSYVIAASIDEYDINKIMTGQQVLFKTNATGDEELEAVVTEIAPRATVAAASSNGSTTASSSSVANYAVKMLITSDCSELRLDMTAKLNIITEKAENVYAVPFAAIHTDDDGSSYIEVEDDHASGQESAGGEITDEEAAVAAINMAAGNPPTRRIRVTVGVETDYYVEVDSPELYDGMVVVVSDGGMNSMDDMMSMMGAMGGM